MQTPTGRTRIYGYDAATDSKPRIGAIILLVFHSAMLLGVVLEVAITRDWCISCDTLTDRGANVDWGLAIFAAWLGGGLLHMIQAPGSKLGFIITMLMASITIGLAVVQDMAAWGRWVECRDNTVAGDTEFCDQNYHEKPLLLVVAVFVLFIGGFAIGVLILAAYWFSQRRKAGLFPEEMISMPMAMAPPASHGMSHNYSPLPPPVGNFAPPTTNAAAAVAYQRARQSNSVC